VLAGEVEVQVTVPADSSRARRLAVAVTKEQIEADTIKLLAEGSPAFVMGEHIIKVTTTETGTDAAGDMTFNTVITGAKEHMAAIKASAGSAGFKTGLATKLGVPNLVVSAPTSIVYLAVPRPAAPPGATETNTVSFGFAVAADAYDPDATSGPTSPAAYAAALAAEMGVAPADVTVTAVRNAGPPVTWSVTAVVDAGDDAAAAKAAADKVKAFATSPAELASALNLPVDAVESVAAPTVAVEVVAAPGATEQNTVTLGFVVAGNAYDPNTSPAAYAAALAAEMGVPAAAVTVTAVRNPGPPVTYSVTAVVDAGDDAAAAQAAAARANAISPSEMASALNVNPNQLKSVAAATVAQEFVAAPGATEQTTVTLGFAVAADAYNPDATSGPTSPAAYAAALALKMGVAPADVTVTAVRNAGPPVTWSVTAVVDAGDDAAAADKANALTSTEMASALNLPAGSVQSVDPPTVEVGFIAAAGVTEQNTVSWGFNVAAYDPANSPADYAAALAAEMGAPFKAADFTVTAIQNADGTWTVSVEVDAGADAAAAARAEQGLDALTPAELATALDLPPGSIKSIKGAEVEVEFVEVPMGDLAALDDSQASNQTVAEDEMSAGAVLAIIIVVLLLLIPLTFVAYARYTFGEGKELDFVRYKLSHSNAKFPLFYMPKELREEKLSQLYTKPKMVGNQQDFDDLSPGQAPGGETEEEKKMRLYFEGEKKGEKI